MEIYRENIFDKMHRIYVRHEEEERACMICTDPSEPLYTSEMKCCGQRLHEKCRSRWIYAQRKNRIKVPKCPYCKQTDQGFRSINDLTCEEFLKEVRYWWGDRPFWYGDDRATPDSPITSAYWGMMRDWAEPYEPERKCYLGSTRAQVVERIKMYLSF